MSNCNKNNIIYKDYDDRINNCINYQNKCLDTHLLTSLKNDLCSVRKDFQESVLPNTYILSNFKDCNCNHDDALDMALNSKTVMVNDGYGSVGNNGCLIDNNSYLRYGMMTNNGCINQTYPRINSVPNMSRGPVDVCAQSVLSSPELTNNNSACDSVMSVDYDRFIPMVPCLKNNVQNDTHIIPELSDPSWVRGGLSSRDLVKNTNYLEVCN